ncbi:MAG: ATP-grasp domain-containing protein [Clostridia bacterium]|nr:ATP-grasp domain-containing protein [Clostridia bacterium]
MKNVVVFFGGEATEHDVSVITGVLTLNSVDKRFYNPIPIYIDKDGSWYSGIQLYDIDNYKNLEKDKLIKITTLSGSNNLYKIKRNKIKLFCSVYTAINCMHGERGEDGSLSGLMKMFNIPFASPDTLSSSICMDKIATKIFLRGLGVNCLPFLEVNDKTDLASLKVPFDYPLICKPACGGSSIGIKTVEKKEDLFSAIFYSLKYGKKVIIEPKLNDFTEINCAVCKINGAIITSECEQPVGRSDVLSFEDKYENGKRIFPAKIDKKTSDRIKEISKNIYEKLNIFGTIRIDFFISYDGEIILNEINTVPGSLAYYLFTDSLKGFSKMLTDQIEEGNREWNRINTVEREYQSGILSGISGIKGQKHL